MSSSMMQGLFGGPAQSRGRFSEPLKWLPVLLVSGTITFLWYVYAEYHWLPMLQMNEPARMLNEEERTRGIVQASLFHVITFMLVYCYVRCIVTHPGAVPESDSEDQRWEYEPKRNPSLPDFCEMKKTGERRDCKWCAKYKPDRAHHCKTCNMCILKMDHHCPWVYNCIGFKNYKYFFLTLVYAVLDCHLILWTMLPTTQRVLGDDDAGFGLMFITLFGETLAGFLAFLLMAFFGFHCWLMTKGMTTIEWCENKMKQAEDDENAPPRESAYVLGVYGNVTAILGTNPLLWLLPFGFPTGDGLTFSFKKNQNGLLGKEIETGRGIKLADTHSQHPLEKGSQPTRTRSTFDAVNSANGYNHAEYYATHLEDSVESYSGVGRRLNN